MNRSFDLNPPNPLQLTYQQNKEALALLPQPNDHYMRKINDIILVAV